MSDREQLSAVARIMIAGCRAFFDFAKRLAKGHFAAPWARKGDGPLMLTTTELALLLEGNELLARMPLSPPVYTPADRVLSWG